MLKTAPPNRIKQLREERKMTQDTLAGYIGAARSSVSMWEQNLRPIPVEYIFPLMSLFNVSSDYILGLSPNRHNSPDVIGEIDLSQLDNSDRDLLYNIYLFLLAKKQK